MTKRGAGDERRRRIQTLYEKGLSLLDREEFAEALEVAEKLHALRWSGSFEIEARAHVGLGDPETAIQALERGVAAAPDAWANWELLGRLRSDGGDYGAAEAAYLAAARCPDAPRGPIDLNRAVVALRRRDPEAALRLLDAIADPELRAWVTAARLRALELLGRTREAVRLGLAELSALPEAAAGRMRLVAQLAALRLVAGEPKEEVRGFLMQFISDETASPELLGALRELDGVPAAEGCRYYRVVVHAQPDPASPSHGGRAGYFATYDVVAPSARQGLRFIRKLVGARVRLRVAGSQALERRSEGLQGVYWCAPGRTSYAAR